MHINLEAADDHAVQAYSDTQIQINSIIYQSSLIVSKEEIITDLAIKSVLELNNQPYELFVKAKPELIVIGHKETGKFPPVDFVSALSKQRIGVECMSLGAACRTFNVLLSENRPVMGLFLL